MKVNGFGASPIDAYLKNNRSQSKGKDEGAVQGREATSGANAQNTDKVHFSGVYMEAAKATKEAVESPDVRQERVDTLKSAIKRGDYNLNLDMLAIRLAEVLGRK